MSIDALGDLDVLLVDGELAPAAGGATFDTVNPATEEVLGVAADGTAADMDARHRRGPPRLRRRGLGHRPGLPGPLPAPAARRPAGRTARSCGRSPPPRSARRVPHHRRPVRHPGRGPRLRRGPGRVLRRLDGRPGRGRPDGHARRTAGCCASRPAWSARSPRGTSRTRSTSPSSARRSPPAAPSCSSPRPTRRGARRRWPGSPPSETDIPPGVLNVVTSSDHALGAQLSADPRVDLVSFTGSTATGRKVMAGAAEHHQAGVPGAGRQVGVRRARRRRPRPAAGAGRLHGLHPRRPGLRHHHPAAGAPRPLRRGRRGRGGDHGGARRRRPARTRARSAGRSSRPASASGSRATCALARDEGGAFACGGGRPADRDRGFFIEPTLVVGLDNDARVAREEIFGPVLVAIPHDGDDDAVAIANDSPYGLSGAVLRPATRSGPGRWPGGSAPAPWASTAASGTRGDVPFGGYKQSGIGREMGVAGFEEYLETKAIAGRRSDDDGDRHKTVRGQGRDRHRLGRRHRRGLRPGAGRRGCLGGGGRHRRGRAEPVAASIAADGGTAIAVRVDVADPTSTEAMAAATVEAVRRHRPPGQQRRHLRRHGDRPAPHGRLGLLPALHGREHGRRPAVHPGLLRAHARRGAAARSSTSPRPRPGCTRASTGWPRSA